MTRFSRRQVLTVAGLTVGVGVAELGGFTSSASASPSGSQILSPEDHRNVKGHRNIALRRAVLQSSYAAGNFNNVGHLTTDGLFTDPTATPVARPVVTASSADGANLAVYGFDYHLNGQYWQSTGTLSTSNPQWLAIDLLSPTSLRSYRVQPEYNPLGNSNGLAQNYPTAWEFQGSHDGAAWTTLDSRTGMTGLDQLPSQGRTFPLSGANYQNYRILVTAASATTVRIAELYLFGDDGYPVVPKPAFASYWQSSTAAIPHSLTVDLGAPSNFDTVKLMWLSDTTQYATDYHISVSANGTTFDTVKTVTGASGWNQSVTLPTQSGKRYVKVEFTARVGTDYRLQAFEVWGTNNLHYTLPPAPAVRADEIQYLTGGSWKLARAFNTNSRGEELSTQAGAATTADWLPATVPGTVLMSFLKAGAIVDPAFSDYQTQVSDSYFTDSDWWYTNTFTIAASLRGKRTWLNFQAINWKANIYLNGHRLGTEARSIADGDYDLEGAYTPGKFDITRFVKYGGTNYLAVLIKKNDYPGNVSLQTLANAGSNGGYLGADNATIEASVGWDWLPTIRGRNIGIYEDVYLSCSQDVLIENAWVVTDFEDSRFSRARLTPKMDLTNASDITKYVRVSGTIGDIKVSSDRSYAVPAHSTISVSLPTVTMRDPKLWWPNGYGDQPLYDTRLTVKVASSQSGSYVVSDEANFKTGIRELRFAWTEQPDLDAYDPTPARNPHAGMNIYVNGTRIVANGGNWGLSDQNMANTSEDYDLKMRLHKEANLNIVRNWVGMTGNPAFYDAADKYGIMIMDDFWLANPFDGPNAHNEQMFMASAIAKVKRVRSHVSVAFYCGRNEGIPSPTLEPQLRALTATGTGTLDPTRTYVSSSASPAEGMDGNGPYGVRDALWYFDNTPAASGYNGNGNGAKNLSSERGQLNIPTIESMHRMLGDVIPWPPVTSTPGVDVWGVHDFTTSGATEASRELDHISHTYDPNWVANGFEEFIKTAQLMNYDNHRSMFEAVFVNDTPGLMQWMSQSAWPSMAWQTYDYYYDLNGGFYGEKLANQRINPILDIRDQTVFLSNESRKNLTNVTVKAEVYNLRGVKVGEDSVVTSLPAGGRSSQFTQAESIAQGGVAVSDLLYKRVGLPLLTVSPVEGLSGTRFVRTSVVSSDGKVLGSNFYWTNPDTKSVWPARSRTNRGTNAPTTWTDYTDIRTTLKGTAGAPVAPVVVTAEVTQAPSPEPGWAALTVKLTNTGDLPAMQIRIKGLDEKDEQILPFIADDNYITLMPGESRTLRAQYKVATRKAHSTFVGIDGFNVADGKAALAHRNRDR
ncbi:glycosyl hydrolase 2 galactose-binding domain-containing protein [Planotetraspora mira]|uniref:F5/8 type C domain-containing protein n=1 Tax=Planotetraspora mira TaxID=58121 RepID=A0A8J3X995_9ACTN|nr:discoidin domain-containing protein [Planotetraspora mira]GII32992.1 hypothetical protein Pmi06nite_64340 [Planotetraspora mira]